ncbi:MAG: response regulator transcription factor [Anaerolineae bacterium]|nr:response regulator transcription factor [Anaerolineae bacterium]
MPRQSVLVVVANRTLERRLCARLEQHYRVQVAQLRREALQCIEEDPPDLVIVDVPSIRFDINRFFEAFHDLPAQVYKFLLLGRGMRLDQMPSTNGYLRHPFTARQLIRRLQRVVPSGPRNTVEWRGLCLDVENRLLIWRGNQVPLTPKQASLARVFLESPRVVISREQLMHEVWGTDYMGDTRTLDVHIHWLRKALDQTHAPFELETERGVGYRMVTGRH